MQTDRSGFKLIKLMIVPLGLILFGANIPVQAQTFKIASYNVENLFDLHYDGTEYPGYIPNTKYGWTKDIFEIKLANIAKVIKHLNPDVIALQEVESERALIGLRNRLKKDGLNYPYYEIADSKPGAVKCAVLSKFLIVEKKEIKVADKSLRNILKVTLKIQQSRLILFINHWKSKQSPESYRIILAKTLKQEIDKYAKGVDFILAGDFNSNYNEHKTFINSKKLNDTAGITGINHILKTIKGSDMVSEKMLTSRNPDNYMYNLWLEVAPQRRWSYNFYGRKSSLDAIILSQGLYDGKGVSYIDNSFNKFAPDYLFKERAVYRWQRNKRGKGRHLGSGYSDHLPVFAYFSTQPFCLKK